MVNPLNPIHSPDWDNAVRQHPDATVFHSSAWARVLIDTYGHQPFYQLESDGTALRAAFPVMEARSWLAGRRGVCLPFSDFCGPLGDFDQAIEAMLELGRARAWKFFEWRGEPAVGVNHRDRRDRREHREAKSDGSARSSTNVLAPSPLPSPSSAVERGEGARRAGEGSVPGLWPLASDLSPTPYLQFYNHSLALNRTESELFDSFDSSMRRAIRKAEKSGVSVSSSTAPEAMEEYFRLHCLTRRKHGLPPQSVSFFRNIQRHLIAQTQGLIVSAVHQGRMIAASMYLWFGRNALYKFGASDEAYLHLRANNLVMWAAIRELARRGFVSLGLGRTSMTNDGLRRFKQSWGTTETVVAYHRYDFRQQSYVQGEDKATGWYNPVFRMLPSPLARPIGTLMYKHLI